MSMTVLAIILIVIWILEIFGFTAALFMLKARLEDIRLTNEKFSTTFLQYFESFTAVAKALDDKLALIMENSNKQIAILEKQYEAIDGAYEIMSERYRVIGENYTKLLECWKNVEERYSDCYEQISEMNKHIGSLAHVMEQIALSEEPVDCSFNFAGECQNEECPALNMHCTVGDPKICRYSNLAEQTD